jgi:hypothetical protein
VDAEETSVLRLNRNAEQQAFESRPGALEILAVLANTATDLAMQGWTVIWRGATNEARAPFDRALHQQEG